MTKRRELIIGALTALVVLAVVSAMVCDARRIHRDPLGVYGGLRLVYRVDAEHAWRTDLDRRQLAEDAAATMRARGLAMRWHGRVTASGDQIEVLLPVGDKPEAAGEVRAMLIRSGRLELRLVDDGSEVMKRLVAALPPAGDGAVTVGSERWTGPGDAGGAAHEDVFLSGPDRETLARAAAALVERNPLPPDHELLLERGPTRWRTYYLWKRAEIDNRDIAETDVAASSDGPQVVLGLTPAGTAKLAAFSKGALGRKMAIVLEGVVASAPVIMGAITNGRARITLGRVEGATNVADEARRLKLILGVQSLPGPLILVSEDAVQRR